MVAAAVLYPSGLVRFEGKGSQAIIGLAGEDATPEGKSTQGEYVRT